MQPIQDKEFDQLFKNAFDNAEIAPSRDLWSNIEADLEPKKTKKIPFYWLAAAVVLIVAATTLIFNSQNTEKIQLADTKPKETSVMDIAVEPKVVNANQVKEENTNKVPLVAKETKQQPSNTYKYVHQNIQETDKPVVTNNLPKDEAIAQLPTAKLEPAIKQISVQPEVKDETVLAITTTTDEGSINEVKSNTETENKGIRNVGDLVNLVVNKVDKRKDKFIQFRTDDDDSSLASINIGPFKFGKRNKK